MRPALARRCRTRRRRDRRRSENPSAATLWRRLAQHRGRQPGDVGGPRRSHSVFRRHVGTAVIRRDRLGDEVLDDWFHYRHQPLEEQIELAVSRYIGVMPFLWLDVPDRTARMTSRRVRSACCHCVPGAPIRPLPAGSVGTLSRRRSGAPGCGMSSSQKGATIRAFWI
jgi:hypothetical protein